MAKSRTNKPVVVVVKKVNRTTKSNNATEKSINKKSVCQNNEKIDYDYSATSPKVVADIIFSKIVERAKSSIMPSSKSYDFANAGDRMSFVTHVANAAKSAYSANRHYYDILNTDELVELQKKFDDLQQQYESSRAKDYKRVVGDSMNLAKAGERLANAVYLHNCVKTNLYNLTCEFYRRYICDATNGEMWEKLCNINSDEVNFIVNLVCELDRSHFINEKVVEIGIAKPVPLVEWLVFAYTTEDNSEHDMAKETLERMGYID